MFSIHNIETVRASADEMMVMRHGEVVDCGLKCAVPDTPRHRYAAGLADLAHHGKQGIPDRGQKGRAVCALGGQTVMRGAYLAIDCGWAGSEA